MIDFTQEEVTHTMLYPYVVDNSKLTVFFNHICIQNVPKKVTSRYLLSSGFLSSNDRLIISVLKFLGLIDSKGIPSEEFRQINVTRRYDLILSSLVTEAYKSIFQESSEAYALSESGLHTIFSKNSSQTNISSAIHTFKHLCSLCNFSLLATNTPQETKRAQKKDHDIKLNINININTFDDYEKLSNLLETLLDKS